MRLLYIYGLFFWVTACTTAAEEHQASLPDPVDSVAAAPRDTLKELYRQYLMKREDLLPTEYRFEAGKVNPVDQAPRDTAFFVFRERLLEAVKARDRTFLLGALAPDIKVDFGGGNGISDFEKTWGLDSKEKSRRSEVWPILQRILERGGLFYDDPYLFSAPYTYAAFPDRYDSFSHAVIDGAGVRMRAGPGLDRTVMKVLSYDIVEVKDQNGPELEIQGETYPWVQVQTLDGTLGFVWGKFVVSPIGFRAGFAPQPSGAWKMIFLVAGD